MPEEQLQLLPQDLQLELMRRFYEVFPYPARPLFFLPRRELQLLSHGGFGRLILKKDFHDAQLIWRLLKEGDSNISHRTRKALLKNFYLELVKSFPSEQSILLLGCGTDEPLLFRILHRENPIYAVDLSQKSLNQARKKVRVYHLIFRLFYLEKWAPINFIIGNADAVLSSSQTADFDFIQCFGVLHHQVNPHESLGSIAKKLKSGGLLRVMLYSYYGRRLERKIQGRYRGMWNSLAKQSLFKWSLMLRYYALVAWQFFNFLGLKKSTRERFRYLGLGRRTVADALMHPSDHGLKLDDFYATARKNRLKLIFCEARIHGRGLRCEMQNPEKYWQEIVDSDRKGDLLSNPILMFVKEEEGSLS